MQMLSYLHCSGGAHTNSTHSTLSQCGRHTDHYTCSTKPVFMQLHTSPSLSDGLSFHIHSYIHNPINIFMCIYLMYMHWYAQQQRVVNSDQSNQKATINVCFLAPTQPFISVTLQTKLISRYMCVSCILVAIDMVCINVVENIWLWVKCVFKSSTLCTD